MPDKALILQKLDAEISRIADEAVLGAMKPLLVVPRCEMREWDYGEPGQEFPCWIVLDHIPTNTCISYCEYGFGPSSPWGLLFIEGRYLSMGMDSGWYSNLEDAFRGSMAWDGDNPPGYEVA
ncbi:MAG: hypothetical protein WCH39_27855 [Schlesneria sp.]